MIRYRVLVSGRVQGVFFRDTFRRLAQQYGVAGWVRNLPDGRVEAVFEGLAEDVERLVEWPCYAPAARWSTTSKSRPSRPKHSTRSGSGSRLPGLPCLHRPRIPLCLPRVHPAPDARTSSSSRPADDSYLLYKTDISMLDM